MAKCFHDVGGDVLVSMGGAGRRGRVYFGGQLKPSDRVVLLNPLAMDQPGAMDDDR